MQHRWVILATCAMVLVSRPAHATSGGEGLPEMMCILAVGVVALSLWIWLFGWATRRVERLRAAAKPLTPIDYLLWGTIGAAPGGLIGGMLSPGSGMGLLGGAGGWGGPFCVKIVGGAIVGAGIAVWRARRRYDSGCSRTAQLTGYATQCRKQGQDDESIAQTLRASGWDEGSIEEALGRDG